MIAACRARRRLGRWNTPAPLAAAAQLALLMGIVFCIGRVLALIADALTGGPDGLP